MNKLWYIQKIYPIKMKILGLQQMSWKNFQKQLSIELNGGVKYK